MLPKKSSMQSMKSDLGAQKYHQSKSVLGSNTSSAMQSVSTSTHFEPSPTSGRQFILLSLPEGTRDRFERDIVDKGWSAVFRKVNGRIDFAPVVVKGE